jgi:hypothetical protein
MCWQVRIQMAVPAFGAPGVQARKEVIAVQAQPVARFGYEVLVGCGNAPGCVTANRTDL